VVESRAEPHRKLWAYRVAPTVRCRAGVWWSTPAAPARSTAWRSTSKGHLWCGWGSDGRPAPTPALDGVRVFDPPPAAPSATSTCPNAAPTCASAAGTATGCSWRPAIRSTRCTSTCRGPAAQRPEWPRRAARSVINPAPAPGPASRPSGPVRSGRRHWPAPGTRPCRPGSPGRRCWRCTSGRHSLRSCRRCRPTAPGTAGSWLPGS
jgi:hypothetical protein